MASTAKGALLTDQYRRRQVALAITADSQMRRVWDNTLDVNDLDRTQPIWKKAMLDLLGQWWKVSADTAAQYLPRFRKAETGDGDIQVGVPRFNRSQTGKQFEWGGVANILWHVAMGQTQEAAYAAARELFIGMFHEAVLTGGRLTLQQWAAKDARAIGWRRVSDGHPCAFCAMLCSRGPVYTSEQKALRRQTDGEKFHPHCGCTVEVVYGDWNPSDKEKQWIDNYYEAAESLPKGTARTYDQILPVMRRTGDYRDSHSYRSTPEYRAKISKERAEKRREVLRKRETELSKVLAHPGKPMSITQADRGTSNPGFADHKWGCSTNCQSCVVAYDARRKGYDVEARARTSSTQDRLSENPNSMWVDRATGLHPRILAVGSPNRVNVVDRIERHVGIGQRWCMHFGYTNQHAQGHIVIIERPSARTNGGEPVVIDPQNGKISRLDDYLDRDIIDVRSVRMFRVDDKDIVRDHAYEIIKPKKAMRR